MSRTPIPVLLYHSVRDEPVAGFATYTVSPATLAAHLDAIVAVGATTITVSELAAAIDTGTALAERTVVITFDDGYADNLANAAPLLAERHMAATLYMTTGSLEPTRAGSARLPAAEMLTREHLVELHRLGVEIGAHSEHHLQLDIVDAPVLSRELEWPKKTLEDVLGVETRSFAYPHGYAGRAVRAATRAAGYRSAVGVRNAFSSLDDEPFQIARLTVSDTTSFATVCAWIDGRAARIARKHEMLRTKLWRSARRYGDARATRRDRARAPLVVVETSPAGPH